PAMSHGARAGGAGGATRACWWPTSSRRENPGASRRLSRRAAPPSASRDDAPAPYPSGTEDDACSSEFLSRISPSVTCQAFLASERLGRKTPGSGQSRAQPDCAANASSWASLSTFRLIWLVASNVPCSTPQLAIQSHAQRASSSGIGVGSLSWMRPRLKSSGVRAWTAGSPAAQPSLKYDTYRRLSAL